jgi:hypothetical protein
MSFKYGLAGFYGMSGGMDAVLCRITKAMSKLSCDSNGSDKKSGRHLPPE